MAGISNFKAWGISISLHVLVLASATWILNEIQAPPPEQVFRWDVAVVGESTPHRVEASADVSAKQVARVIQTKQRIIEASTRRVMRVTPKIIARSVRTRVDQSTPKVTSTPFLQRTGSQESRTRTLTEGLVTEVSAQRPSTRYVEAAKPLIVEGTSRQVPQASVLTNPVRRTAEKAGSKELGGPESSQVVEASDSGIVKRVVTDRPPAEKHPATLSNAAEVQVKAAEGLAPRETTLAHPNIVAEPSASVVRRPSPIVVHERTALSPVAIVNESQRRSTSASTLKSALVAVRSKLETKLAEPSEPNPVRSVLGASNIEGGTVPLEAHEQVPINTGTLVARTAPQMKGDFRWLAKSMHRRIANLKRYPYLARINHWEGKVVLRAVITDDGQLADVSIKRSSGHDVLDQEALKLVRHVCPVPLEHPLGRPQVVMHIPITYKLEN